MAHAYFAAGDLEEGIADAIAFVGFDLGLTAQGNPDVLTLRHGLLSVEDARKLQALAELAPTHGDHKALIISASRLFHEAQNALLKFFEEPPAGTTIILVLPAEGMLLPTLRSRLISLPREAGEDKKTTSSIAARAFLDASTAEREKLISKLLDRAKSDKDDEKQAARLEALHILEGLIAVTHDAWLSTKDGSKKDDLRAFLSDLNAFLPILHERSAPLKLIFEHILLVVPAGL